MPREVFRSTKDLAAMTATRLLLWWWLGFEHEAIDQADNRFERCSLSRQIDWIMLTITRSADRIDE